MQRTPFIDVLLTPDQIDIAQASDLSSHQCGAVVVFVGKTRPETHPKHGDLVSLKYTCYEDLAKKTVESIAIEAAKRFPVHAIRATHAICEVAVNEPSIVIAVGGMHRDEAFQACRFLIDTIKDRCAIWKKEQWSNGSTWSEGEMIKLQ